jgi:hypothetical protein
MVVVYRFSFNGKISNLASMLVGWSGVAGVSQSRRLKEKGLSA